MAVIECHELSKWYGDVIAVNDLTVDIRPGITGFLGPNGAGKSSFMRMAMGLAKPSHGQIRVLDENPWDNAALLRRVGYVPEGDAPWRDQTGREAATLSARLSGLTGSAVDDAVARALKTTGLEGVADREVETYSRGTRQRLKLALALLPDPELLILDEPLLGTDPLVRKELIETIKGLAAHGKSVVLSTHVLSDVEAMTQRILLMSHGRLLAHGEVSEIRDLLEQYPRAVRVGTPDPRKLAQILVGWETVLSVRPEEGALLVETRKAQAFFEELQSLLAKGEVPFTSVTSPDDNVEALFRYLVGSQ